MEEGKLLFKEKLANENSIDGKDDLARRKIRRFSRNYALWQKITEMPYVGYEQVLTVGNLYISLKINNKKKLLKRVFWYKFLISFPIYVLTQ